VDRAGPVCTERLSLLPLRVEHADEMAVVLGDPGLHAFTGGAPLGAEALRSRYGRLVAGSPDPATDWLNWVIEWRGRRCLVGTVQATVTAGPVAEVAWVVGSRWQGQGIASEAAIGLVGWLTGQRVHTVVAHIHPGHAASAAVATAAGLTATDRRQDGEVRWHRRSGGADQAADSPRSSVRLGKGGWREGM